MPIYSFVPVVCHVSLFRQDSIGEVSSSVESYSNSFVASGRNHLVQHTAQDNFQLSITRKQTLLKSFTRQASLHMFLTAEAPVLQSMRRISRIMADCTSNAGSLWYWLWCTCSVRLALVLWCVCAIETVPVRYYWTGANVKVLFFQYLHRLLEFSSGRRELGKSDSSKENVSQPQRTH
jgi:hypothetical protein